MTIQASDRKRKEIVLKRYARYNYIVDEHFHYCVPWIFLFLRQEIMRVMLAIALLLVAGSFIAAASKGRNYPRFFKHRMKLREIRGFKPEYISTAIGFGKRESPERIPDLRGRERILLPLLRNFPRGVSAEMLLRMMQANPALVEKMAMQNDRGDEESMNHLKPDRTFALI